MERSRKRRKLSDQAEGGNDSPSKESNGIPSALTSTQPLNGGLKNETPVNAGAGGKGVTTAVHEVWKEAKAKSQAQRGRRIAPAAKAERIVDVYDDIEGAHQQSSVKQKPGPASTPLKPRQDPLRNQRSGPSTSSPSKAAAALGFFKQFHKPKAEAPTTTAPFAENGGPNGFTDVPANTNTAQTLEGQVEHDRESVNESTGRPGWTYAIKPKRTFEDEIREVAEAARERAERGEDDESAAALSRERRSRIRTFTPDGAMRKSAGAVKAASLPKPRKVQAQPKQPRKQVETQHDEPSVQIEHELPDAMDLDAAANNGPDEDVEMAEAVETVLPESPSKTKSKAKTLRLPETEYVTFAPEHLEAIQAVVIEKLTSKRPVPLRNLEVEYSKVSSLIAQTVTAGESNSMLLIGARGSGKSALVNQILREQAKDHEDDFHIVRLNGIIHTDDKIALREIWRQLGREMEVDDDDSAPKNYADTLTTLLALLSHPAEQGREQQQGQMTKSVIFIIDEFELFATHPRQMLLYNLFDIAQSRKAPIAVLGLTTRIDVAESLEKRVKSRFSHRYVHLGMSKSFNAFQEACKDALIVLPDDLTDTERVVLGSSTELTESLAKVSKEAKESHLTKWNAFIDSLVTQDSLTQHLHSLYYTSKSIPDFHTSMLLPISSLPTESSISTLDLAEHISTALTTTSLRPPDSKLDILSSLSTLHLALLICAARLTAIHSVDNVPFAQAYEEYKALASKAKLQASAAGALAQGAASRVWSKDVARDAWADLVACGLVMEDGVRGCRVDVGLEEIGMAGVELGAWGRWCRHI